MKKILFFLFMSFVYQSSYAFSYKFKYYDGEIFSGKVMIEDIGSFYVSSGYLELDKNLMSRAVGKKLFIPFTKKSNSYLVSTDNNEKDIDIAILMLMVIC